MSNSLVSIDVIPSTKEAEDYNAYVDAAIAVIKDSNVTYEVHPMETTMEGELSVLLGVVERINEKMVSMGSTKVISFIKILHQPEGIAIDTLMEKYR